MHLLSGLAALAGIYEVASAAKQTSSSKTVTSSSARLLSSSVLLSATPSPSPAVAIPIQTWQWQDLLDSTIQNITNPNPATSNVTKQTIGTDFGNRTVYQYPETASLNGMAFEVTDFASLELQASPDNRDVQNVNDIIPVKVCFQEAIRLSVDFFSKACVDFISTDNGSINANGIQGGRAETYLTPVDWPRPISFAVAFGAIQRYANTSGFKFGVTNVTLAYSRHDPDYEQLGGPGWLFRLSISNLTSNSIMADQYLYVNTTTAIAEEWP